MEANYCVVAFDIDESVMDLPVTVRLIADQSKRLDVKAVVKTASQLGQMGLVNNVSKWKSTPVTSDWQTSRRLG